MQEEERSIYFVGGYNPEKKVVSDELGSDDYIAARFPNIILGAGTILQIRMYLMGIGNLRVDIKPTRTFKGIISASGLFSAATYYGSVNTYGNNYGASAVVKVRSNTAYKTIKSKLISIATSSKYAFANDPMDIIIQKLNLVPYTGSSIFGIADGAGRAY